MCLGLEINTKITILLWIQSYGDMGPCRKHYITFYFLHNKSFLKSNYVDSLKKKMICPHLGHSKFLQAKVSPRMISISMSSVVLAISTVSWVTFSSDYSGITSNCLKEMPIAS